MSLQVGQRQSIIDGLDLSTNQFDYVVCIARRADFKYSLPAHLFWSLRERDVHPSWRMMRLFFAQAGADILYHSHHQKAIFEGFVEEAEFLSEWVRA